MTVSVQYHFVYVPATLLSHWTTSRILPFDISGKLITKHMTH